MSKPKSKPFSPSASHSPKRHPKSGPFVSKSDFKKNRTAQSRPADRPESGLAAKSKSGADSLGRNYGNNLQSSNSDSPQRGDQFSKSLGKFKPKQKKFDKKADKKRDRDRHSPVSEGASRLSSENLQATNFDPETRHFEANTDLEVTDPPQPKVRTRYAKDRADRTPEIPVQKTDETAKLEPGEMVTFRELGLDENLIKAVEALGFETPTPIQAKTIPLMLAGGDLIGQAQTGTGKTAAFGLPVIQTIDPLANQCQALILAPTRELAVQVAGGIYDFAKNSGLKIVPVYGGQPIDRQFRALKSGCHVVVGTPGRVLDHLRRGSLVIANVKVCILDEADEMLALGFAEDLEAILAQLPETRQLALFSATMPSRILSITKKFLKNATHIEIKTKQRTLDTTNQTYYEVPRGQKLEALARVLDMETPGPTIVFCRTRHDTNELCENLRLRGYNAEALHGDMNQPERDRVMKRFREGQADLLVATDIAARGLDIETVTHVVNYDIPWDVEQYIHRIGRTGRAGRAGDAITLVSGRERAQLHNLERMIGSKIKPAKIPTAADISSRRREQFEETLREALAEGDFESQLATVESLSEEFSSAEIAAAALTMLWKSQHSASADVAQEMAHDQERPEMGMSRIFIGIGRQDGLRPGDLVGAIANEAGVPGSSIGVIDVLDRTSFVEVPTSHANMVVEALRNTKIRNMKVKVQLTRNSDGGSESHEPASRGNRRNRRDRN